MPRDPRKGKQVKTFTAFVPGIDLKKIKTVMAVKFDANSGEFFVRLPNHIAETIRGHDIIKNWKVKLSSDNELTALRMQDVLDEFESALSLFIVIQRDLQRKKVIAFWFRYNTPMESYTDHDISFCGTPALFIDYEVMWQVAGRLYHIDDEDPHRILVHGAARHQDGKETIIEWTEDRELFFANMKSGIIKLIDRLVTFQSALGVNADAAIKQLMQPGQKMLAAPEKTDDTPEA